MERTRTDDLEAATTAGVVRGRRAGGRGERSDGGSRRDDLRTWRGIPYAAPPVGPRRWRAPAPVEPWEGVRETVEFGPVPPQDRGGEFVGAGRHTPMGEDCLTLNVVAPAAPEGPLPVMVWFYGGAFVVGASSSPTYRGYDLVRSGDVVYVSVNYRLGALGYLDFSAHSTPERPIESNLGLRDQIAALEWVRDNIAAFGGDPDRVTVFGESAGAISVTTLMTVPSARGLFHRAIAQSAAPGVAYSHERAAGWADRYARDLGVVAGRPDDDPVDLLETASTEELLAAARRFRRVADETPGVLLTAPVVDGDLIPEAPLDAFAAGRAHPVPLIIGTNDTEGRLFELPGLRLDLLVSDERADAVFAATQPELREQVLAAYRGTPHRRDLGGDYLFWYPSVQLMEAHAAAGNPVYAYRYDLAPRLLRLLGLDAMHGMELYSVFGLADSRGGKVLTMLGGRGALRAASRRIVRDWTAFAHTGAPAGTWPRYTAATRLTRIIDSQDRIEGDPRRDRRLAWQGYRGYR